MGTRSYASWKPSNSGRQDVANALPIALAIGASIAFFAVVVSKGFLFMFGL
jgi:hypothetical protein